MHSAYHDIRDKIDEQPQWWDEHAVPRYCSFSPERAANIYADTCVLLLIACQNCGQQFNVCFTETMLSRYSNAWRAAAHEDLPLKKRQEIATEQIDGSGLRAAVENKTIHYGDPPNACCGIGASMNSVPLRVLEFWSRKAFEWKRVAELEVNVEDELAPDTSGA